MVAERKFLGVRLTDGTVPGHLGTVYLAAFATICLGALVNMLQPYLLSTFLGLGIADQGEATGVLGFANEFVIVLAVGTWGALSDRWGRRPVWAVGFVVMALGFVAMPLGRSLEALVGMRALYAAGIAAATAMLGTVVADYVRNEDRGKANAFIGIMSGLGAVTAALLLSKLPRLFTGSFGYDGIAAGWMTYGVAAGIALGAAVVVGRGMRGGLASDVAERARLVDMLGHGVRAGRDPGTALSYAASFVARPDLAVAAFFIPLWFSTHYLGALPADAPGPMRVEAVVRGVAEGGGLIGIIGGAGLLFAPVIGVLSDRINRALAVALALVINTVGYGLVLLVDQPTDGMMKVAAVFIGFGQVSGVIATQVLVQQQAPARVRGSVIGVFGICGGLGIMFATWLGGTLFDAWAPQAPFGLLAVLNGIVAVAALAVHRRVRAPRDA